MELLSHYSRGGNPLERAEQVLNKYKDAPPRGEKCGPVPHRALDRLGPTVLDEIVAMYLTGQPSAALAREFGVSKQLVLSLLHSRGVELRRRGLSPGQVDEAIALYAQGWSHARIGEHLDFHHSCVRNTLLKAGVTMRGAHDWQS